MKFLEFGTIGFYTLFFMVLFTTMIMVHYDTDDVEHDRGSGFRILILFLICIGSYSFFGNASHLLDLAHLILDNLGASICWVILYLLVGTVWSFYKWYQYLLGYKEEYKHHKKYPTIPQASRHKNTIGTWIFWWPISCMAFIFSDMLIGLKNLIFTYFEKIYDKITKKVFGDIKESK